MGEREKDPRYQAEMAKARAYAAGVEARFQNALAAQQAQIKAGELKAAADNAEAMRRYREWVKKGEVR